MKLNCDLGESFGRWQMSADAQIMPYIDQANIACGFHAGDPLVIYKTLLLAKKHKVSIGAHPSYPDLVGFGRRSMKCSKEEIIAFVLYQIAAIDGMTQSLGLTLAYVKPHGALYNDMMVDPKIMEAILTATHQYQNMNNKRKVPLKLMIQATPEVEQYKENASNFNIELLTEAFADRCYQDNGKLVSRNLEGAVHNAEKTLEQVKQLINHGSVTTKSGNKLAINADSLCLHGDNDDSVKAIADIRALIV